MQAARAQRIEFVTSVPLLVELADVLARPKFTAKIAASQLGVEGLVERYAALASVVRPAAIPRVAPDPDDDDVIAAAIAATAEFIVTGDRAFLSVAAYQGVRIIAVHEAAQAVLG